MADHGITCSMSRSGNVWDNAAMESFFSSPKTERTARKGYRTRDDARADVFDYIERFYNPRRRHSTLGYLSPVEFEEQAMLACRPVNLFRRKLKVQASIGALVESFEVGTLLLVLDRIQSDLSALISDHIS